MRSVPNEMPITSSSEFDSYDPPMQKEDKTMQIGDTGPVTQVCSI